eukprot:7158997-Karenia_brevis.AAC.1
MCRPSWLKLQKTAQDFVSGIARVKGTLLCALPFPSTPGISLENGDLGPPNSPLGSQHGDDGSQYGFQHGSGADSGEGQMDDKMLKAVSAT